MQITIHTEEQSNNALFLRTLIADGTSDDGTKIEIALSGAKLVLQHQAPDADRIVHTISLADLVQMWAITIDRAGETEATPLAGFEVPEPLAGVIQVGEFDVFRNAQGEHLIDATNLDAEMRGELILVRQDGSTATLRGDWETGWSA